jgi:hypothetical protein
VLSGLAKWNVDTKFQDFSKKINFFNEDNVPGGKLKE